MDIFIHFRPFSPFFIHSHPLSSTFIHINPLSSALDGWMGLGWIGYLWMLICSEYCSTVLKIILVNQKYCVPCRGLHALTGGHPSQATPEKGRQQTTEEGILSNTLKENIPKVWNCLDITIWSLWWFMFMFMFMDMDMDTAQHILERNMAGCEGVINRMQYGNPPCQWRVNCIEKQRVHQSALQCIVWAVAWKRLQWQVEGGMQMADVCTAWSFVTTAAAASAAGEMQQQCTWSLTAS